jgi:starvation-inducible outer membrane lipoprotein
MNTSSILFAFNLVLLLAACSSDPPRMDGPGHEQQLKSCADRVVEGCAELLEQAEQHANCLRSGMRKCIGGD